MSLNIEKGRDILCMRFLNVGGYDCIDEHLKIMDKKGYVWLGKIGNKPTDKALNKMLEDDSKFILLKEPQNAYICKFEAYSENMPEEGGYSSYYKTEILPEREFSLCFKLVYIKKVEDMSTLSCVVVKSSRAQILEIAKKINGFTFLYCY